MVDAITTCPLLLSGPALVFSVRWLAAPVPQSEDSALINLLPLIIVGVVLALIVVRQIVFRGASDLVPSEPGRIRNYGAAGGAVCRNCGRPFARSMLDPNMLVGKLVRCPYCKKWAVLPAASPAELASAEDRERRMLGGTGDHLAGPAPLSEEEQMRRRIENSKYE